MANFSAWRVDSASNVYVADRNNNTIRKVTPAGVVTTLAGLPYPFGKDSTDGTGSAGRFNYPTGVAVDSAGNVYVADTFNNMIRKGYSAARILNSGPGFGFNDREFGFNLTGPTGKLVMVEASTDLVSWLPIWTNTLAAALSFRDPQSSVSFNRFLPRPSAVGGVRPQFGFPIKESALPDKTSVVGWSCSNLQKW